MPVIPTDHIPLRDSSLNLDISGVAGFFGGDVAVSAMGTVSLYEGRKWFGWYNSPGSYEIAKRYGRLAQHRLWSGLYPGVTDNPAVLFELDGKVGPRYRAVHSGTSMDQTGHLAYLLCQECKDRTKQDWDGEEGARKTFPIDVSIVYLHRVPPKELSPRDRQVHVTNRLSFLPILTSAAACLICAFVADWFCCSMIGFGMFCSGVSCWVIGSGEFKFTHPEPAAGAPVGDGYLMDNEQVVILRGAEGAVNPITRGRFSLQYDSHPRYHNIGWSSVLLTIQFLLQLLVVPQGTIFGQVMFLASLAASWLYNSFLSSLDKEIIQRRILVNDILAKPALHKYRLGTRTAMAVFVMLVLSSSESMDRRSLRKLLDDLLPNDTDAWCRWKYTVVKEIALRSKDREPNFQLRESTAREADEKLLKNLYGDAQSAYEAFKAYTIEEERRKQQFVRDGQSDMHGHSTDELDEKVRADEDANEKPERDMDPSPTLGYTSDPAAERTGDSLRPESAGGWSSASTYETRVGGLDCNWHGTCNPTEANWHGSCY
ncbi:hypothetical protein L226DRAFT_179350 [Lentinus tigrinus ALCF2SS1-7]|uniref:Uncharacterized protein n=1 Tax=Lentinus tigrinus ALCF2SS1-6 TaxID=1328759 RepID=A0A5C2SPT9_9APHY|nr:hypothetical protein L227DRAFT_569762 [Lentinus tigrinus ALCF2SS1-6]RPD79750.1 hypothetical protein L226DRAFT_179350 [Lentinus tigrinus ALCF2SS1-7]